MNKQDCELFVDIRMSEDNVLDLIHKEYGGTKGHYSVDCEWAQFHIESNGEYSWFKKRRKDNGFLYYRFRVYVESKRTDEFFEDFVDKIRKFIVMLKEKGAKVVPACDFEDELNS